MNELIVDLSNNNGFVDFPRLAAGGIRGVYLKATEGRTYPDGTFRRRRELANAAGLHVGAYHFAAPYNGNVPEAEARNFLAAVGKLEDNDLKPALDMEGNRRHPQPDPLYAGWSRAFNRIVKDALGAWPLFYSYPSYIDGMRIGGVPIGGGLWLASFGRNDGAEHGYTVPRPWRRTVLHQFTSNGRVAGVSGHCDVSRCTYGLHPVLARPWLAKDEDDELVTVSGG